MDAIKLCVLGTGRPDPASHLAPGLLRVGAHEGSGAPPIKGLKAFGILLTRAAQPPRPWVGAESLAAEIAHLQALVGRQPLAATAAAQVHRMTLDLGLDAALQLESFAYSTLLASEGVQAWRRADESCGPKVVGDRPG